MRSQKRRQLNLKLALFGEFGESSITEVFYKLKLRVCTEIGEYIRLGSTLPTREQHVQMHKAGMSMISWEGSEKVSLNA